MNRKTSASIALFGIIIVAAVAVYFLFIKQSCVPVEDDVFECGSNFSHFTNSLFIKTVSDDPTQKPVVDRMPKETAEQMNGTLRQEADNSWTLMSFDKDTVINSLQFTDNSICVVGPDEGLCSALESNFNTGSYSPGGGDNVSVDGNKQGSTIIVRKLIFNDNFVMNGSLAQDLSQSGQDAWSLVFQPPVGDSALQDSSRPTSTIPLTFDEKSFCGDTGEINCDLYTLHQNDQVFVRGIKYKDKVIVRILTIPAQAPPPMTEAPPYFGFHGRDYILGKKIKAIESAYPELKDFENQESFAGQSVKTVSENDDAYFAYIVHGSGVPIIKATCFKVDGTLAVLQLGEFSDSTSSSVGIYRDVDPKTCLGIED